MNGSCEEMCLSVVIYYIQGTSDNLLVCDLSLLYLGVFYENTSSFVVNDAYSSYAYSVVNYDLKAIESKENKESTIVNYYYPNTQTKNKATMTLRDCKGRKENRNVIHCFFKQSDTKRIH